MAEQVPEVSLLGKIAGYTEILSKDPRSTVFVPLSEAYRKMKMLDDAIAVASKGVAALPHYAPGHIALARAQAEHGLIDAAALSFENVLRIEEENLQGIKGLARVRMMQGRIADARTLLAKAKRLAPGDPQIDGMLDSLSHAAPGSDSALPAGDAVAKHDAEAPIATATLAEIYVRQGLHRKAYNIYRELSQSDPNNRGLLARMAELKELLAREADGAGGTPVVSAATVAPPAVAAKAEATPVAQPARSKSVASGDVVERLNHWLEVIQRRRHDVR